MKHSFAGFGLVRIAEHPSSCNAEVKLFSPNEATHFLHEVFWGLKAILHSMAHSSTGAFNFKPSPPQTVRTNAQDGVIVHEMEAIVICLKIAERSDILISFLPQV